MNLFDKRPLSLILCIILGGFVVFSYFGENIRQIVLLIVVLIPIPTFIFKPLKKRKILFLLISLFLILSCIASYFYFDRYFKAYEHFDGEVEISGEIVDLNQSSEYSATATIKTDNISEERFSRYKILIDLEPEIQRALSIGDKVSFKGELKAFESYGSFNSERYYFSNGISARVDSVNDFTVTEKSTGSISYELSIIREKLRREAILMSDKNTGTLLGALLTGERDALSEKLKLDFLRIGITHILALSGMHLAILSLAIERLLRLFRIPKKLRTLLCIIFCLLYMGFTGFPVSVVRAGIMLIISSLLRLINESHDSVTSLFIAVFIIVLINPCAIFDISLWLSAFATLGVIIAAVRDDKRSKAGLFKRVIRIFTDSIYASVLANGATLAISAYTFGGLSLLSPFSTFIFSFIVEIYMYIGCIMLAFGLIFQPLSNPFGFILTHLYDLIEFLSSSMSESDIVYLICTYETLLIIIIVFTAILFSLFILKLNKRVAAALILVSYFSVFTVAAMYKLGEYSTDALIYSEESKSDLFLIKSGKTTALVNSSQYSKAIAYDACDLLKEYKVTSLDKYIITHYAYSLEEDFEILLSSVLIKKISIPHPKNEQEITLYKRLIKFSEDYSFELTLHNEGGIIKIGNFKYYPLYSLAYGEGASTNAALITYNDTEKYLYLSSGMLNGKLNEIYSEIINEADIIIFGSHGKKYKDHVYIDERYSKADKIMLSSYHLYFTQKSYIEYIESGCKIISHPQNIELLKVDCKQ